MNNNEFLAVYSGSGFFVASYQKRLIEEVIDAKEDETALSDDEVFSKVFEKRSLIISSHYMVVRLRCLSCRIIIVAGVSLIFI